MWLPCSCPCSCPGELSEYVVGELNVLQLETCSDMLAFSELSAVPDWQALGKRLGKDMGRVAAAIKGLSMEHILAYEKSGSIELAGYTLGEGDIKVRVPVCLCFGRGG